MVEHQPLGTIAVGDEPRVALLPPVPVTVLSAEPNVVIQKKNPKADGYSAVQLGSGERRANLFTKPMQGHYRKVSVEPRRFLRESRLSEEEAEGFEVGQEVTP